VAQEGILWAGEDSKGKIWHGAESLFRLGCMRLRTASEMAAVQSVQWRIHKAGFASMVRRAFYSAVATFSDYTTSISKH
jgi:hypothetical protein